MQPKLKIKTKNEEDIYASVIEKSGVKTEFTIHTLLDHMDYTKKKLKETKAQIEINETIDKATLAAIPGLADLVVTPEQLRTVIEYFVRQNAKPEYESLVQTCEVTLASYKKQLLEIEDAFGIMMPSTVRE